MGAAIDDGKPGHGDVQFSNFSLLEDRKNHPEEIRRATRQSLPTVRGGADEAARLRLSLAQAQHLAVDQRQKQTTASATLRIQLPIAVFIWVFWVFSG
jgi:hypothetical protein